MVFGGAEELGAVSKHAEGGGSEVASSSSLIIRLSSCSGGLDASLSETVTIASPEETASVIRLNTSGLTCAQFVSVAFVTVMKSGP